jgi:hypothetical protein
MSALAARALKDKAHLVGLAGLFLLGLLSFVVVRALLVPRDFGELGHFRRGALADNQARTLVHAGRDACAACHTEEAAALAGGRHAGVGCEAGHGPLAAHADDPEAARAARPDGREICLRCHTANTAKPLGFPQIAIADHDPEGTCTECHAAHHPTGEQGATP